MLGTYKTYTSFSAPDLATIKDFYTGKLGLEIVHENEGAVVFQTAGDTRFMVYQAEHQPAGFTVLNFEVGEDLRSVVKTLNAKGVKMEQYPEMGTDADGIATWEDEEMAWFKDPAGNIIGLMKN